MNNPTRGKSASGMRFIKRYPNSKPVEKTLFEETDEFTEYVSELPCKIFNLGSQKELTGGDEETQKKTVRPMTAAVTQRNHGNNFSVTTSQEKIHHRRIETGVNKHLNHRNL
jgi:hypothetical protein